MSPEKRSPALSSYHQPHPHGRTFFGFDAPELACWREGLVSRVLSARVWRGDWSRPNRRAKF